MDVDTKARVGIEFDPEAQKALKVPLGKRELSPNAGMKIAEVLKEQDVTITFGVPGGHLWQIIDEISRIGIKTVTFNHEQNAVYAAEAYAQVGRKMAVAYATAGPGMTNATSPVLQAFYSQTPVFMILGSHDIFADGMYLTMQEGYAEKVLGSITKHNQRVHFPTQIKGVFTRAAKAATSAPRGPVAVDVAINNFFTRPEAEKEVLFGAFAGKDAYYQPNWRGEKTSGFVYAGGGDPQEIAEAVERLQQAKSPILVFGDGAHWDQAGPELEELVSLLKVPFAGRRMARGLITENHPYAVRSLPSKKDCDLLVSFGHKVGMFENWAKAWPDQVIQIAESPGQIYAHVKTDLAIVASIKTVAKQMVDYIKAKGITPPVGREEWNARLQGERAAAAAKRRDKAQHYGFEHPRYRSVQVCHPGYIASATQDYLEEHYQSRVRVMVDGFTMSDFGPSFLKATRSAQILASAEQGGVGHGVGMAIGAMFAQLEQGDRTPILAYMGDGGMGQAAMDIEVAARYKLPIVYHVSNNDGWMPAMKYLYYGKNWDALGEQDRTGTVWNGAEQMGEERRQISYADICRSLGCYVETVRSHDEYLPALHRCFQAAERGQTVVLDVITDKHIANRVVTQDYAGGLSHIPYHELPKRGKAIRRNALGWYFKELQNEPEMPMPDPWEPLADDEL